MIRRRKPDITLEVIHDAARDAWLVRALGGDPAKVFAIEHTRAEAFHVATALAKVFAWHVNRDGSCEIIGRQLDGEFGERRTFPRSEDPREVRG